MKRPRTAHVVGSGRWMPQRNGTVQQVRKGYRGVWCEACEYAVMIPVRYGADWAEQLRRQHLGTAHLSELIAGNVVINAELADLTP